MTDNKELRLAQKSLYTGANAVADAGMRLQGTRFEKDYERVWQAISTLNEKLISAINRK